MKAEGNEHDFIVRLEGLNLDEAAKQRIAGAIQGAVMAELGRIDLRGQAGFPGFFPRKDWLGFILRDMGRLRQPEEIAGGPLRVVSK